MRFSLLLATIERTEEVERFLASLEAQDYPEVELIVIDQNPDDRLVPILQRYEERFEIRRVHSARGLSRARNVGLEHARGDVVGFPDDDCWYPPGLLAWVARFLSEHPDYAGVTGRSVHESGSSPMIRFDREAGLLSKWNVWRRAGSYTMFFRSSLVRAVGPFDETLGLGAGTPWEGGEDIDYPLRALAAGFQIYYHPGLHVFHPDPFAVLDWNALADRGFRYGAGIGRVWRKHAFPKPRVAAYLLRPLVGSGLSLCLGRWGRARYHWRSFLGRAKGWLAADAGGAPGSDAAKRNAPKVFGIGLNKTGTTTLGLCFEELGLSHTGYELELLRQVGRGDLQAAFATADRYESFEDWPWPLIYRELAERYPEARFVLTTRKDVQTWLRSLKEHADRSGPTEARELAYGHPMPDGHEEAHLAFYERHNREVRRFFADRPDRLLEVCWELGSGWKELCEFLGKEVPDTPLPHASHRNRTLGTLARIRRQLVRAARRIRGSPSPAG